MADTTTRKADHLDLCATPAVAFQEKTTLLEQVHLVHDALPELEVGRIDLTTSLVGHTLRAPLVIAGMTGGVERAAPLNRDLAAAAQAHGIALGLGSMRPLLEHPDAPGYEVRDVAPDILLIGNIGVVQARETATVTLAELVKRTGCSALAVHLNPAMEQIQAGGDQDFTSALDTIDRLVDSLGVPIVVKETGCGLSRSVGRRLAEIGVRHVDTGGAGGTSWVGVETLRAPDHERELGEAFWDWGIPTAASVLQLQGLGLEIIATGGVHDGLDVAKAIALGARAGGLARPFLQAWTAGGPDALDALIERLVAGVRTACLLTGSRTPGALVDKPRVLGSDLQVWSEAG